MAKTNKYALVTGGSRGIGREICLKLGGCGYHVLVNYKSNAAEAEKTRLQGEGQANYRREIANGIVDQIKSLQAVGMNVSDVNNVVLFNQYLDTMRNLASSQNTKTVVLPASTPGGFNEMRDQVIAAMEAGK